MKFLLVFLLVAIWWLVSLPIAIKLAVSGLLICYALQQITLLPKVRRYCKLAPLPNQIYVTFSATDSQVTSFFINQEHDKLQPVELLRSECLLNNNLVRLITKKGQRKYTHTLYALDNQTPAWKSLLRILIFKHHP